MRRLRTARDTADVEQYARADREIDEALRVAPNDFEALKARAWVLLGRHRFAVAPHPENRFELARALVHAGAAAEAAPLFAQFERDALAEADGWDNANRELVAYCLDHAHRPADALRIAASEATRRQDVYTLTAWAAALHATGRDRQARELIARVRAVGTKDPDILARAATIMEGPAEARRGTP